MKKENKMIELAEQQITGFAQGFYFGNIISLVENMNLTKEEWEYLKKEEMVNCLEEREVQELNEHFKK